MQCISGRVLRLKVKERSLRKPLYPLHSTGSTQEDRKSSARDCKIVDWDVTHQRKKKSTKYIMLVVFLYKTANTFYVFI